MPLLKNISKEIQNINAEIGEVIICLEVVKENAKKFGVTFKQELAKILIHGVLHLCGYNHEGSEKEAVKMETKEKAYLAKFKI